MEAQGIPGAIQVTERAYERLAGDFVLQERGTIEVRGKGPMRTYLLVASGEGADESVVRPALPVPHEPAPTR
jgi:class 3 adenylate cyclase